MEKSFVLPTTHPEKKYEYDTTNSPDQSPSKSIKRLLQRPLRSPSPFWSKFRTIFFIIVAIVNLVISIYVVVEHGNLPELFPGDHDSARKVEAKKCYLPELSPFSPEMRPFLLQQPERIDCTMVANSDFKHRIFFKADKNNNLIKLSEPGIPCCYRPFFRVNDNEVKIEPTRDRRYVCHNITKVITPIPPEHEFIEIICDDSRKSYRDGLPFFFKKPKVEQRIKEWEEEEQKNDPWGRKHGGKERLSVIVLGIDSTSQQNFIRKMPKSLEYLTNTLGATRLDGYVKVGENTLPNVVPLLTGLGLDEFKDLCVLKDPPMQQAVHLDACPFVWKHFKDNGYRTLFAEDEVNTGIFNLYWSHAFLEPPTDYYLRPYSLRMIQSHNLFGGFCMGPRMSFQVILDYLEKAVHTFNSSDDAMFNFLWESKLSHDDLNRLGWGDQYLAKTLRTLNEQGKLNHSALILLSDHGSRKTELRSTRQGQLEDRLPLAYISLPPWFKDKYPAAWNNLQKNSKVITSAYDIHETLLDFTDLKKLTDPHTHYLRQRKLKVAEKKGHRRGTSLFTSLPEYRGCASAGIPPHWCICYKKKKIAVKSLDVHEALSFVLREINGQLRPFHNPGQRKGLCATLKLKKVVSALKWHPEDVVSDSFNGNSEESYKKASLLQINFIAVPQQFLRDFGVNSEANFEVTVLFDPDHGWKFTEQVVRLDPYEGHSACMKKQELKKLCMCNPENEDPEEFPKDALDTGHDFIF